MYNCIYCNNNFVRKHALIKHQRVAKYCLNVQRILRIENQLVQTENVTNTDTKEQDTTVILDELTKIGDILADIRDETPRTKKYKFINKDIIQPTILSDDNCSTFNGYIYLIQEREFKNAKQAIYKIGMSCQNNPINRVKRYPKDSNLICIVKAAEPRKVETALCNLFRQKFKHRDDIGREYFEGCAIEMSNLIYRFILDIHHISDLDYVDFALSYPNL